MSSRSVLVEASSLEILFEGNLLKAPPLNRRGRKKWHERYFILRANRTLECHKSRKAADAQKSPRRIVDLRECINLEIGLEYKNVQHIMSLGTFKRTFFYAAPSDPLMLLWADVLEKAKNAQDGDHVEVLDIGLRRTKDIHAVHNVRSSQSPSRSSFSPSRSSFSPSRSSLSSSPKRGPLEGGKKNAMALSHFANGSTDTVDLRMFQRQSESPSSHSGEERSTAGSSIHRYPSASSTRSRSVSHSPAGSPVRTTLSGLLNSPKGTRKSQPNIPIQVTIPSTVPPPKTGALAQASRNKDGFFVNQKKKDYRKFLEDAAAATSTSDHAHEDSSDGENLPNSKEFVSKEGNLKRVQVIKAGHSPQAARHLKKRGLGDGSSGGSGGGLGFLNPDNAQGGIGGNGQRLHGLRRSFRYRKISLRTEFERPLFETTREESESEDEGDTNSMYQPSSVPGPQPGGGGASGGEFSPDTTVTPPSLSADSSPSHKGGGKLEDDENEEFRKIVVVPRHAKASSQQQPKTLSTISMASHSAGNSYSKVTLMGPRRRSSSSSSLSGQRPAVPARSNSQSDVFFPNARKNSSSSSSFQLPSPIPSPLPGTSNELVESLTMLPPPLFDALDLTPLGRTHSVDGQSMYGSQNSLDNILVEPPEMFVASGAFEISSSEMPHKRKLSRTRKVGSPVDAPAGGSGIVGASEASGRGFGRKSSRGKIEPIPADIGSESGKTNNDEVLSSKHRHHFMNHHNNQSAPPHSVPSTTVIAAADRDSTESSDTGYTSSTTTSPGYYTSTTSTTTATPDQQQHKDLQKTFHHHHHYNNADDYLVYPEEEEEEEDEDEEEDSREVPTTPKMTQYSTRAKSNGAYLDATSSFGGNGGLRKMPSVGSLASISSENSRCYIPLVFHSGKVEDAGANPDPNLFSVQVCLVENSDELIKDLVSVKTLESFSQVECDEIHGEGNVAAAQVDDFTVETSLEDLEFGFSIIKSTQKDLFSRKVRQFTFEVKNLFGTSKPFSCDVEIKHAGQLTVLPIEVM